MASHDIGAHGLDFMTAGPLAILVTKCLKSFKALLPEISNREEASEAEDQLARFKIWAANLRADRDDSTPDSLSQRLRHSSSLLRSITDVLKNLQTSLQDVAAAIHAVASVEDHQEDPGLGDGAQLPNGDGQQEPSHKRMKYVRDAIDLLFRLSPALLKPARHDFLKDASTTPSETYAPFEIDYVKSQFPAAPQHLVSRLGLSVAKRKQFLHYAAQMHREEGVIPNNQPVADLLGEGELALETATRPDFDDSIITISDVRTVDADEVLSPKELRWPEMPMSRLSSGQLQCPICFASFSSLDRKSWRRHILDDITPYICLCKDCPTALHQYSRRRDWQHHELSMHYRVWTCPFDCLETYTSADTLEDHLVAFHDQDDQHSTLRPILEACSRLGEAQDLRCPLCEGVSSSQEAWYRHIGYHQEQLALHALPDRLQSHDTASEGSDDDDNDDEPGQDALAIGDAIDETADPGSKTDELAPQYSTQLYRPNGFALPPTLSSTAVAKDQSWKLKSDRFKLKLKLEDLMAELKLDKDDEPVKEGENVTTDYEQKQRVDYGNREIADLKQALADIECKHREEEEDDEEEREVESWRTFATDLERKGRKLKRRTAGKVARVTNDAGGSADVQPTTAPTSSPAMKMEPLRFRDENGARFRLPFELAQTWDGMKTLIGEIYEDKVSHGALEFGEGSYDIIDSTHCAILPSAWETMVQPGATYQIRFWKPLFDHHASEAPYRWNYRSANDFDDKHYPYGLRGDTGHDAYPAKGDSIARPSRRSPPKPLTARIEPRLESLEALRGKFRTRLQVLDEMIKEARGSQDKPDAANNEQEMDSHHRPQAFAIDNKETMPDLYAATGGGFQPNRPYRRVSHPRVQVSEVPQPIVHQGFPNPFVPLTDVSAAPQSSIQGLPNPFAPIPHEFPAPQSPLQTTTAGVEIESVTTSPKEQQQGSSNNFPPPPSNNNTASDDAYPAYNPSDYAPQRHHQDAIKMI